MALHARWSSHTDTAPGFPYVADRPGDVITLIAASNAHHA
jgi:hypothetical protein